jgi:hypothetical protein
VIARESPTPTADPLAVKQALEALHEPAALSLNPLIKLPVMNHDGTAGDLRELLLDVIGELAESRVHTEAQAGRLLLDYYIKRAGSHEVIKARLHLSRPTYFRRLNRGFALVAQHLDRVSEFVVLFQL